MAKISARTLVLLGSCTIVSLSEEGEFLRKESLGETVAPQPGRPSNIGLFMCKLGPDVEGCCGCLGRPRKAEGGSSVDPLV